MRMANRVDPDQTAENDSADLDQNAENSWEWQWNLTLIRLMRMANGVELDQTENGK